MLRWKLIYIWEIDLILLTDRITCIFVKFQVGDKNILLISDRNLEFHI